MARVTITKASDFSDAEDSLIKALQAVQSYRTAESIIPDAYLRVKTKKVEKEIDKLQETMVLNLLNILE